MIDLANNAWNRESLYAKAQLYVEQMENSEPSDWKFGLWSAFSLEFFLRATLANISPVLLADTKNWRNLTYALGHPSTKIGFNPISISTKEVLERLSELVPEFTKEIAGFCSQHISKRNAELHSGESIFMNSKTSDWLPKYYQATDILLKSMHKDIKDIFNNPSYVESLITSLKDEAAKLVKKDIDAFSQVWSSKSDEEKEKLKLQATAWAIKQIGHRVECPSCKLTAILQGSPIGNVTTDINEDADEVIQYQFMSPVSFECIACGLKISGYSKLSTCGLGEPFKNTITFTPAEYFELYTEDDLHEAKAEVEQRYYQPDFNE
ncbi:MULTISPECIES: hypothetical protein [Acinetobacter]|nr:MULTISPECIES: hypothetical protein [Acinetobacter]MCW3177871.1 hypothetical protein [Acinetobacter baumannii]RZH03344.1 hypothetical protein EXE00_18375 [Acinetobacter pittii]